MARSVIEERVGPRRRADFTTGPTNPWGGDDSDGYTAGGALVHKSPVRSRDAHGHPFPRHAQVTTTPVVANLDDDNGDGLIDELDLPELVFTSFECDESNNTAQLQIMCEFALN